MLEEGMKEVKRREKRFHNMIETAEEMIPRKDGVLSPKGIWDKKPEETKKILGTSLRNKHFMSNEYLERAKDVLGDHI